MANIRFTPKPAYVRTLVNVSSPIVFELVTGSGFVASLARPGVNVTGLSIQSPDLVGKRHELLQEVVPGVRRLAVMANGNPGTIWRRVQFKPLPVRSALTSSRCEIAPAFELAANLRPSTGRCNGA